MRQSSISSIECNIGQEFGAIRGEMFADMLARVNDPAGSEPEGYPGPGRADEGYAPTPDEEAWWSGYTLALDGVDLDGSLLVGRFNAVHRANFLLGQVEGRSERYRRREAEERERIMHEAWLEEQALEAEMLDRHCGGYHHPAELVEAVGCIEARKG